jgi:hypothetical protein
MDPQRRRTFKAAQGRAVQRLIDAHRDEYQRYYDAEVDRAMADAGLTPVQRRGRRRQADDAAEGLRTCPGCGETFMPDKGVGIAEYRNVGIDRDAEPFEWPDNFTAPDGRLFCTRECFDANGPAA